MRAGLTIILLAAALWRAGLDWQATIGQGYAYRLSTIGNLFSARWPERYGNLVEGLKRSGLPWAWDPAGAFLMSLPLALMIALLAAVFWLTRPRSGRSR